MIDEARILLEEERYDDVLAVLRDHLGDDATSEALQLAGLAHMGLRDAARALPLLERAASHGIGTQRYSSLMAAADAAQHLGDLPTAEHHLLQALEIRPDSVGAGVALVRVLVLQRNFRGAELVAQRTLESAPGHAAARIALATALFGQRRFVQVQTTLNDLAAAGDAVALALSGRAAQAGGNAPQGLKRLLAAYRLVPADYRLSLRVSRVAEVCGKPLLAEEALRRAATLRPDVLVLRRRLAAMLVQKDRAHEAIVVLQQILQQKPGDADAGIQLGLALHRAGRLEQTVEQFSKLSADGVALPENAIVALAKALSDGERLDEAESVLRSSLDQHADWHEARLALGVLLAGRARYDEALPFLDASVAALPEDAAAWYFLAHVHFCLGDLDSARREAERALALRPGHGRSTLLLRRMDASLTGPGGSSLPPAVVAALAFQKAKAFQFTGDPLMQGPRQSLLSTLHDRWVVISALMFRTIQIKYVGNLFAYAAELWTPLSTMLLFLVLFTVVRHRTGSGDFSVPMFILTGFGVMSLFNGATKAISGALGRSVATLAFPCVRPIDLQISQIIRNTTINLTALVLFATGMFLFDVFLPPHDIGRVILCLFMMVFIGTGWGLNVEAIKTVFPGFRFLNQIISRAIILSSGVFLPYEHLPTPVQQIIWWNPLLHVVELLRQGFSPMFVARELTLWYPITAGSLLLTSGIIANLRLRGLMLEGKAQEDNNDDPLD